MNYILDDENVEFWNSAIWGIIMGWKSVREISYKRNDESLS